jgi:hypothetical protein
MGRKRVSIKGIGATIFYDSDQPLLDLMQQAAAHIQPDQGVFDEYDGIEDLDSHDLALLANGEPVHASGDSRVVWDPEEESPIEPDTRQGVGSTDTAADVPPFADDESSSVPRSRVQPASSAPGATASYPNDSGFEDETPDESETHLDEEESEDDSFDPDVEVLDRDAGVGTASAVAAVQAISNSPQVRSRPDVLAGLLRWEQTDELTFDDPTTAELVRQVNVLYDRVAATMTTKVEMARQAMDLLQEARGLLASGEPSDVHAAERKLNEVKMMLLRVERIGQWSQTYGWGLFIYEIFFILVFLAALVYDRNIAAWFGGSAASGTTVDGLTQIPKAISAAYPPWSSMVWGGLGGAVAAIFSLQKHVAELSDFDRRYTVWYVVQPFSGMMLGSVVYLAMVITLGIAGLMSGAPGDAQPGELASYWIPSLVACLAGFRQKYVFAIVEKLLPSAAEDSEQEGSDDR